MRFRVLLRNYAYPFVLSPVAKVNAFVCTIDFIIVELTELVLVPVSTEPDIDDGALNFTVSIAKIYFGVFISSVNLACLVIDFC
ncbi:hypothetical protein Tco_0878194 [Tanacetum coccineum]|uniref:Uncharacterized protein n=1 Tax=Tanacetum coccineum TaxID=301880 RepID=A0ABQ5C0N5_9ASTR